jgi:hypothetical protein
MRINSRLDRLIQSGAAARALDNDEKPDLREGDALRRNAPNAQGVSSRVLRTCAKQNEFLIVESGV